MKNSRFVLMPVYGLKTPFGSRTMVCRLHSASSFSLIVVFTPSLCVSIDTSVFSHDVLDGFDGGGVEGHDFPRSLRLVSCVAAGQHIESMSCGRNQIESAHDKITKAILVDQEAVRAFCKFSSASCESAICDYSTRLASIVSHSGICLLNGGVAD